MGATQLIEKPETIGVAKADLIAAWAVLENLVVSLHRIGSTFAVPEGMSEQTPDQRCRMLEAIHEFFTPELFREIGRARRLMGDYLPDEEAEAISDALKTWRP